MPGPEVIPISRRTAVDRVVRDDTRYRRCDLDRSIRLVDFIFSTLGGYPYGTRSRVVHIVRPWQHPENMPSQVASDVVQAAGHVAIADIGCGTANMLLSWGNKVASKTKCGMGKISMTGVSLKDYRGESMHKGTNQAMRRKDSPVRYVLCDAKDMAEIEDGSQDVTLAYNSLRYASQPDLWLAEMIRITKAGGTVLFNSEFDQVKDGLPLTEMIDDLHDRGFGIQRSNFMIPERGPDALPVEMQIMDGTTENAALCRIDVPLRPAA